MSKVKLRKAMLPSLLRPGTCSGSSSLCGSTTTTTSTGSNGGAAVPAIPGFSSSSPASPVGGTPGAGCPLSPDSAEGVPSPTPSTASLASSLGGSVYVVPGLTEGQPPIVVSPTGAIAAQWTAGESPQLLRVRGGEGPAPAVRSTITWEELKLGVPIGRGRQAVVRQAWHRPSSTLYALKCIRLSTGPSTPEWGHSSSGSCDEEQQPQPQQPSSLATACVATFEVVRRELSRLTAQTHPNLVTYWNAYCVDNHVKILMDYMELGSLSGLLHGHGAVPPAALRG
eukprot:RCo052220